jgi:hypothetical protein
MKAELNKPEATRPKFVLWMDADAVPVDFEVSRPGGRTREVGNALAQCDQVL